ncbi:exported hypothetical protein [Microcystis aeruginosa PCC 9443]|uniref:PEP-CTERM protein-sorting domain-containing protein n=1 Tax=Microcystis aeruginosa PCC 9443 TaxID=1160281 RepID=I4G9P0_MICAE|nr:exported hypothetical protein [Microcystis aeruginosa PCC 9443]
MKNKMTSLAASFISVLAVSSAIAPRAYAGFVLTNNNDNSSFFSREYNYFFDNTVGQNPIMTGPPDRCPIGGTCWETKLQDGANPQGGRDLTATIQHIKGAGVPPIGPLFGYSFLNLQRPPNGILVKGLVQQKNHGDIDADITRTIVRLPAVGVGGPQAEVLLSGTHIRKGNPFQASLHNTTGRPLTVFIKPSYRSQDGTVVFGDELDPIVLDNNNSRKIPLPARPDLGELSDYAIRASGSGITETTLAFIGEVDGVLTELDLSAATSLFVGFDPFLVPSLNNQTLDLFVAVDLVQWLSNNPFTPGIGDTFDVANGVSSLLPGFLFSTSEISFVPGTGFVNNAPFNGQVSFNGLVIDGQVVVPEPTSTLSLLALGTLGAASTLKRQLKPSKSTEKETTK